MCLVQGGYASLAALRYDLKLVIDNCLTFNADGSDFYEIAQDLAKECQSKPSRAYSSKAHLLIWYFLTYSLVFGFI